MSTWPLLGFQSYTCPADFEQILPTPKFPKCRQPPVSLPFECDGYHSLPVITVTKQAQIRPYYGNSKAFPGHCFLAPYKGSCACADVKRDNALDRINRIEDRDNRLIRIYGLVAAVFLIPFTTTAFSAGTPVGTVIDNVAQVNFEIAGTPGTVTSNVSSITVQETIDVVVTLQSPQILVAANDTNQALLFTVTNTGNGSETFQLAINSVLGGDDFDPVPSATPIYFDSDASGDFSVGDVAYAAGTNDPVLAADASVDILLLNDIPGTAVDGEIGRSELTADSLTGTGAPGDVFLTQGDGGTDAVLGTTGGTGTDTGEYVVGDVQITILKSVTVLNQFGGTEPIPGATLTYTITAEVTNSGTATASVVNDPIPADTTYVAASISLNAAALTDVIDADAGELDTSGAPTVVVRLGDLTQAGGIQTVVFQVTID